MKLCYLLYRLLNACQSPIPVQFDGIDPSHQPVAGKTPTSLPSRQPTCYLFIFYFNLFMMYLFIYLFTNGGAIHLNQDSFFLFFRVVFYCIEQLIYYVLIITSNKKIKYLSFYYY